MSMEKDAVRHVVGGVDTHKDLHVAAVVDERDRILATASFATTRQGYRQMLAWMRSFGAVQRIGIESTGSYGAGLLRFMQQAGIKISMDGKGRWMDNVFIERLWRSLKYEDVYIKGLHRRHRTARRPGRMDGFLQPLSPASGAGEPCADGDLARSDDRRAAADG